MLQGYKTYIVAGLMAAIAIAHSQGLIDEDIYLTIMGLLAAGGTATLAAKVNRTEK